MTSNKLNVRTRSSALLSVLLVACISPQLSSANAADAENMMLATDTVAPETVIIPEVDAAPDTPLTADELAQVPDAVPVDEPFSKYGNVSPYRVLGKTYTVLAKAKSFKQVGTASWYGKKFHGQRTSSGERFDMYQMTAAHRNLPIPCYARVTNQANGKSVIVKVNDRGPFHGKRVMDVSWAAAAKLDMLKQGTANIAIEVVSADTAQTETTIAQQNTTPPAHFFVQVGAFGTVDNAENLKSQLASIVDLPIEISDATTLTPVHKVQIGPFVDEASAQQARNHLLQVAAINPIIVKR